MTGQQGPGLQLDEHLGFQRTMRVVRRAGTCLLMAGLVAAGAGLLGGQGPLAAATDTAGPVEVRYPRFARYQMPTRLEFQVDTAATRGDTFDIVFHGGHARGFSFENVLPQPERVALADDRVRYTFRTAPGERQLVLIQGQPEIFGRLSGTASVAGLPPLRIDSFVYP